MAWRGRHDQIGSRAGIPAKYYDRMLTEAPDLLATNVNAWHRINPARRMVRTLGGDARSFLSDRYNRIENEEIAKVLKHGADKYGRRNFAAPDTTMRMSTYIGGLLRHTTALQRGELLDPDSGVSHFAHIGASTHVCLAAIEAGTMVFDTRGTEVFALSDRVHVDGDQNAKAG